MIARLLDSVHDDGERLVPTPCPGMISSLQHERRKITEAITSLRASQRALDAMLDAARQCPGEPAEEAADPRAPAPASPRA